MKEIVSEMKCILMVGLPLIVYKPPFIAVIVEWYNLAYLFSFRGEFHFFL